MFQHQLLFLSLAAFALTTLAFGATLPEDEAKALEDIASQLGKTGWNFSVDPCSKSGGWFVDPEKNAVTCNCSYSNGAICHVVSIILKEQNLPGVLPPELSRLPFLQEIDLTRNYLSGNIPSEWASLPLVNISLLANRLTGPIPKSFENISTLVSMTVQSNQLSGELPEELGSLLNLEKLHLSSNNFTGELPKTFAKLTNMKDFRISDNQFTGQIPNFIQSWTKLEKLVIQASGLVGPIPPGIASLGSLSDLRISDLNGPEAPLPYVGNMTLKNLILRSCNLTGKLPDYLGKMKDLKVLDLSFNKLTGGIPESFVGLVDVDYIYLTGNLLTRKVPEWMFGKGPENIDLSYNNFADGSSGSDCQNRAVNLFASSSKGSNFTGLVSCLRSITCQTTYSYVHINCGGSQVVYRSTTFEEDTDEAGPAKFAFTRTNHWAFSSTGHFLDDNSPDFNIQKNTSRLLMNDFQLYKEARISPLSLTYYVFCLENGNYIVKLHFAEIMFTDDKTYGSLGRRIFDVYIQGKLELKDFNIEDEAGGVGKAIVKKFSAVVTNGTMYIRLYWAGKGTTEIPDRGVYGPLISAISLHNPDFQGSSSISVGTVLGIVAAAAVVIIVVVGILWWKGCLKPKYTLERGRLLIN